MWTGIEPLDRNGHCSVKSGLVQWTLGRLKTDEYVSITNSHMQILHMHVQYILLSKVIIILSAVETHDITYLLLKFVIISTLAMIEVPVNNFDSC